MKYSTENRCVLLKLTGGTVVKGNINFSAEAVVMDRVSDLLMKGENKFLVLYNATVPGYKDEEIIVNKLQIVWVMEEKGCSSSQ